MEDLILSVDHLKCPICLNLFIEPMFIDCPTQCVMCKTCIIGLFKTTPRKHIRDLEVECVGRCICRAEVIVDRCVPALRIQTLVNNIITKCPYKPCKWFCDGKNQDQVKNHVETCR